MSVPLIGSLVIPDSYVLPWFMMDNVTPQRVRATDSWRRRDRAAAKASLVTLCAGFGRPRSHPSAQPPTDTGDAVWAFPADNSAAFLRVSAANRGT